VNVTFFWLLKQEAWERTLSLFDLNKSSSHNRKSCFTVQSYCCTAAPWACVRACGKRPGSGTPVDGACWNYHSRTDSLSSPFTTSCPTIAAFKRTHYLMTISNDMLTARRFNYSLKLSKTMSFSQMNSRLFEPTLSLLDDLNFAFK